MMRWYDEISVCCGSSLFYKTNWSIDFVGCFVQGPNSWDMARGPGTKMKQRRNSSVCNMPFIRYARE